MKTLSNIALFFILAGLLVLQGCGGGNSLKTVSVAGTVTLDGQAVEGVNVSFLPSGSDGRESYGVTDGQGQFVLTIPGTDVGSGAMPGEYHVTFSKEKNLMEGLSDEEIEKKFSRGLPAPVNLLLPKYADKTATDIAPVKVEKGRKNVFTFELQSK